MQTLFLKILRMRKDIARIVLGVLFILASRLHFTHVDAELKIIPAFLPWRRQALYITGLFEFIGGVGLFVPRFKRTAAWGLVALLIAVFPANVYHAVKNIRLGGMLNLRLYQWARLPFQGVFIYWVLWSTSPDTTDQEV